MIKERQQRIMMTCLFMIIVAQLIINIILLLEIRGRQIYTTGMVDKINQYCLE